MNLSGSQRHAHSYLLRSLCHRISHHSVDTNSGQEQRNTRERRQQYREEAWLDHRPRNHFIHGSEIVDPKSRMQVANVTPNQTPPLRGDIIYCDLNICYASVEIVVPTAYVRKEF